METSSPSVVVIHNQKANKFYLKSNVLLAGDRAATSSPIAGMGATLGLTCYAYGISQFAKKVGESDAHRSEALRSYDEMANACADRWLKRADIITKYLNNYSF